jgi:hypothetical protein
MPPITLLTSYSVSIIEPRYARDYIPKFQAKFGVPEEEPDGPFQRLVQRYRQGFGHHVVRFQYPRADGAHQEGTPVHEATSPNLRTHDSIPETLMPEGNKSRVSGDGLESVSTTNNNLGYSEYLVEPSAD